MLKLILFAAVLQCVISQQYKTAPGVPPQNYQQQGGYQQPPPPPPPQQQPIQQQQYQPPPPQYQQQAPPPQQFQQPPPQHGAHDPQLLNPTNIAHEREHIQEHMDVPIDTSKMSEQELMFHYFKMHDADNNNKLDGCELIKSLIHWHDSANSNQMVYTDEQFERLLETAFTHTDLNQDGFIDFIEYRVSNMKAKLADNKKN